MHPQPGKREAAETVCLWAAEDKATQLCWADKDKAEAQRREAKHERKAKRMAKERAKAGIQETCRCTWHNWCTCGAVRIAK